MLQISVPVMDKKTISCILCGGVHLQSGPRFSNHLLHEHGIVFNQEYIVRISEYNDRHSCLPSVTPASPSQGVDKSSQTEDLSETSRSHCFKPVKDFLTSTPVRKPISLNPQTKSQAVSPQSPSSFFSTPKNESLKLGFERLVGWRTIRKQEKSCPEKPLTASSVSDLPVRSGFLCKCALCSYVCNDDTSFWGHITKKHGLNYREYKEEHGTCQIPTGSGKFQCLLCQTALKHLPGCVDKHLKSGHSLTWPQYLDWFKEQQKKKDVKAEVVESSNSDVVMNDNQPIQPAKVIEDTQPIGTSGHVAACDKRVDESQLLESLKQEPCDEDVVESVPVRDKESMLDESHFLKSSEQIACDKIIANSQPLMLSELSSDETMENSHHVKQSEKASGHKALEVQYSTSSNVVASEKSLKTSHELKSLKLTSTERALEEGLRLKALREATEDKLRKESRLSDQESNDNNVVDGHIPKEIEQAAIDKVLDETHDIRISNLASFNSRPLNIKDKTNRYCSHCDVSFDTRILFLKHCQEVHKLRFRNKSGSPVVLNQATKSASESKNDTTPVSSLCRTTTPDNLNTATVPITPIRGNQSPSLPQDKAVSSSKVRQGDGFSCQYCHKNFSSYSNMFRHTRLSCMMKGAGGGVGQQVVKVHDKPTVVDGEGGGFKCGKCGKVYAKLGNLNRHYMNSCSSKPYNPV